MNEMKLNATWDGEFLDSGTFEEVIKRYPENMIIFAVNGPDAVGYVLELMTEDRRQEAYKKAEILEAEKSLANDSFCIVAFQGIGIVNRNYASGSGGKVRTDEGNK